MIESFCLAQLAYEKLGAMPTYAKILGSVMAHTRTLNGHSQAQLARKMGIGQSGLAKLEKGICSVKIMQLMKYSQLIDADYMVILQRAENLRQEIEQSGIPVPLKRSTV